MQIIQGVRNLLNPLSSSILTIGNFDGVHLGHQQLVRRVVALAQEKKTQAVVMTFEPHPVKLLHPDKHLPKIFDFNDQRSRLRDLGVDLLVVEPFSREFSQVTAERFVEEWIQMPFHPSTVVVGYDFNFGAHRRGTIDFLKGRGPALGFDVEVIPQVEIENTIVSSSRIRKAVEAGEVKLARTLLGRPFYLEGLVEKGAGRGRTIGIPTANVRVNSELLPRRGVYAAYANVRGEIEPAVVNIGLNPTFNESGLQALSIEAHLFAFPGAGQSGDLYGETLRLEFVDRLRDERKFASVNELVSQIQLDIRSAKDILR